MKKFLSIVLCFATLFLYSSCSIKENNSENGDESNKQSTNSSSASLAAKRVETGSDGFIEPVKQLTEVPEGYVGIYTAEEFKSMYDTGKTNNYILMNDIDLSAYSPWIPIYNLEGTFDGNGHSVTGLKQINNYTSNSYYEYGLFRKANIVKNLYVKDVDINLGTIPGNVEHPDGRTLDFGTISTYVNSIENCSTSGKIKITQLFPNFTNVKISCLATEAYNVKNCSSSCEIEISEYEFDRVMVGGLVADLAGPIENSFFDGRINMSNTGKTYFTAESSIMIGGLVGYLSEVCYAVNCRNSGEINYYTESDLPSVIYIGGISAFSKDIIKDSYNTGKINVIQKNSNEKVVNAGGITGCLYSSYIKTDGCYNTGEINVEAKENAFAGGLVGTVDLRPNWQALPDIKDCFNTGAVTVISENNNGYAGGIAGSFAGDIITSYNNAIIIGDKTAPISPHATENNRLDIKDCYSIKVNDNNYSVNNGVKELSTDEAANASSYSGFTFDSQTETENLTAGLYGEIEEALKYEIEVKYGYWIMNKSDNYKYPIIANTYSEL